MTPEEFLALRVPQPKALTTAQWDVIRADVRERAFFMAGVAQAQTLDLFKGEIDTVLKGEISVAEFRKRMREGLDKLGYKAPAGKEGTIHDLRSVQRLNVVAETNVRLAQGYAGYYRQHSARSVWPGRQMYRQTLKREPRNWAQRWKDAAAKTSAPASSYNVAKMSALIDSAIWTDLSRFGVPYEPFDFNSGMGTKMLDKETTEKLGIAVPRSVPPKHDAPAKSLNDGLTQEVPLKDDEAKTLLKETMEGLADVGGDTVTYRDPNGTIPVAPGKVADVIAAPNNAKIRLRQAEALKSYQEGGPDAIKPGTAKEIYLSRLIERIEGQARVTSPAPISGHAFSTAKDRAAFIDSLRARTSGGWTGGGFPYPTATQDKESAMSAAESAFPLVIRVTHFNNLKDTGPAVDAITGQRKHPELFWVPASLFLVRAVSEIAGSLFADVEEVADDAAGG